LDGIRKGDGMELRLDGKAALITGSDSGIGRSIAQRSAGR
jgi:NAD(P)-dependent dehydrogenase (short-subunit alcohol dehydrogenase family)